LPTLAGKAAAAVRTEARTGFVITKTARRIANDHLAMSHKARSGTAVGTVMGITKTERRIAAEHLAMSHKTRSGTAAAIGAIMQMTPKTIGPERTSVTTMAGTLIAGGPTITRNVRGSSRGSSATPTKAGMTAVAAVWIAKSGMTMATTGRRGEDKGTGKMERIATTNDRSMTSGTAVDTIPWILGSALTIETTIMSMIVVAISTTVSPGVN
jgi:hypothetical protein